MREIGAQSLRCICELDLLKLGPDVAKRAVRNARRLVPCPCSSLKVALQAQLLAIPDDSDVHGGLLALTELAAAFRRSPHRDQLEPERRKVRTSTHACIFGGGINLNTPRSSQLCPQFP